MVLTRQNLEVLTGYGDRRPPGIFLLLPCCTQHLTGIGVDAQALGIGPYLKSWRNRDGDNTPSLSCKRNMMDLGCTSPDELFACRIVRPLTSSPRDEDQPK